MKRDAFERYIEEKYGVQPESLWMKSPEFHVFRHSGNKKMVCPDHDHTQKQARF